MSKGFKKYIGTLQNRIANQRAEIERLHKDVETLTIKCNAWHLAAERVAEELQVAKANTDTLDILVKDLRSRSKELQKANEGLAKWCEELEAELNAAGVSIGEWVRQEKIKGQVTPEAVCSNCGREVTYQVIDNRWAFENYCSHCGTKMKGERK